MDRQPSEQPRTAVYWRLSGALAVLTAWAEGEEGEGCHWCLWSEGHEGGCPVGEARAILEDEAAAPDPVASPAPLDVERLAAALDVLSEDDGDYDLMAPEDREFRYEAAQRLAAAYEAEGQPVAEEPS